MCPTIHLSEPRTFPVKLKLTAFVPITVASSIAQKLQSSHFLSRSKPQAFKRILVLVVHQIEVSASLLHLTYHLVSRRSFEPENNYQQCKGRKQCMTISLSCGLCNCARRKPESMRERQILRKVAITFSANLVSLQARSALAHVQGTNLFTEPLASIAGRQKMPDIYCC